MSIYNKIRRRADDHGIIIDDATVYRIAGTLKVAGATDKVAASLIDLELERLANETTRPPRTAGGDDLEVEEIATMKEIDASLQDGKCPKCHQALQDVKLADYTPARYCKSCGISLWEENED